MARTAAMREGLSVGDWLTRRIVADTTRPVPGDQPRNETPPPGLYERDAETLRDRELLARQLARSEEQSESAFRRIDEALRNLGRRLESTERTQSEAQNAMSAAASEINAATRDQAQAFALLTERIDRVERNADTGALRDAVRGLHQGLSRLAEQIGRTATESTGQISTLAGNIETLASKIASAREDSARLEHFVADRLNALNDRLKQAEERIAAGAKLEETIAFLEASQTAKLKETIAEIETRINASNKLEAAISELETRMAAGDVLGGRIAQLESRIAASATIEQTVSELRSRLDAAATLQDTAGQLQSDLVSLEGRMQDTFGRHLGPIERGLERIAARFEETEQRNVESFRNISLRLDTSETKQRENWDGLRSALEETAKRVQVLEAVAAPIPTSESPATESAENPEIAESNGEVSNEISESDKPAAQPEPIELAPSKAQDYLAQARRAARAAAETGASRGAGSYLTALGLDADVRERKRRMRLSRSAMVAIMVVLALLAGLLTTRMLAPRPAARLAPNALIAPGQSAAPEAASSVLSQLTSKANAGDIKAALALGLKYADGDGVGANPAEAFGWLRKAALAGQPLAQYRLGTLYDKGLGVAADPKQAFFWYAQAAKLGNRKAMHNLAVAYANGLGTEKNFPEAARWFTRAAELGLTDSQFNLAVLFERGLGVETSLVQAYKWYAIATAAGDSESGARLQALSTQLKPVEKDAAEKAAHAFHPAPVDQDANEAP